MASKAILCQCCEDLYPETDAPDHGLHTPDADGELPKDTFSFQCDECFEMFDSLEEAERCELKHSDDANKEES